MSLELSFLTVSVHGDIRHFSDAVPVVLTEKIYEQENPREKIPLPNVAPDKVQIELERTGCFGTCPSYHVIIRGDGRVTYKGSGFLDVTGAHHYQIAQDDVSRLVESLRIKDIWSLRSSYAAQVTDLPTYSITVSMGDKSHRLADYAGESVGMPHTVSEYEDEIDRAARSSMWLHLSKEAVNHLEAEHFRFHSQEGAALLLRSVADDDAHDDQAMLRLIELGAPISGTKRSNNDWLGVRGRFAPRRRTFRLDPLSGAAQNAPPPIRRIGVKSLAPSLLGHRNPRALPSVPTHSPRRAHCRPLLLCQHAAFLPVSPGDMSSGIRHLRQSVVT